MKLLYTVIAAALVSGCAALGSVEDKVSDGITRYCGTVLQSERAVIRGRINAKLAEQGHRVAVICSGDSI